MIEVMTQLWTEHQAAIITVLIAATSTILATVKQHVGKQTRAFTFLDILTDVLAWTARPGSIGIGAKIGLPKLNVPGFASLNRSDHAEGLVKRAISAERAAKMEADTGDVPKVDEPPREIKGKSILLIPLALLLGTSSCVTAKKIAVDVGACAGPEVQTEVTNLLPAVTAILSGGAPDWSAQLTALESIGLPFVVCAVSAVVSDLQRKMPKPPVKGEVDPRLIAAMTRAQTYLGVHGVRL